MLVPKNSSRKYCKDCLPGHNRQKANEFYKKNVETGKVEYYRKTARDNMKKRHLDDRRRLLDRARTRAYTKNVECTISVDDIIVPTRCPALGTEFVKGTEQAMSIDAIDPTVGYIPGNVQVISMKANAMKNSASRDELIRFANWILDA